MTKAELRQQYVTKRRQLTPEAQQAGSEAICNRFFEHVGSQLAGIQFIHTFLPILRHCEVNTWLIIEKLQRSFPAIQLVISRSDPHTLTHFRYDSAGQLTENAWGVPEPVSGEEIDSKQLDLVLVPLLAFDEQGYRVGYGKGFYDRFLAACRPDVVKVGLSFESPVPKITDVHPFDIRLDSCVMPQQVWESEPGFSGLDGFSG